MGLRRCQPLIRSPSRMESSFNISPSGRVRAAGAQWLGTRQKQEDYIFLSPSDTSPKQHTFLAVLADGMGGMGDGDKASHTITEHFVRAFTADNRGDLVAALKAANASLAAAKTEGKITPDAGATLVALSMDHRQIRWLSVGDSLLYRQRGTEITKLNNAHTWQWELNRRVKSGEMTQDQAEAAPGPRQALYAAVCGDEVISAADVSQGSPYCEGDRFIIASDGLLPFIEQGWESFLNSPESRKASPAALRDALLDKIKRLQLPNQDNTSVIVVDIVPSEQIALPIPESSATPKDATAPFIVGHAVNATPVSLLGNRSSQQDAVGCWQSEHALLAVVADGAGGHSGGAIAARMAVKGLEKLWHQSLSGGMPISLATATLSTALQQIHTDIIASFGGKASRSGKCAIVVLYQSGKEFACLNAGDCRAYISDHRQWAQLSVDDSILRLLIERGQVSPAEARNHPDQNILTQALGASDHLTPHVYTGTFSSSSSFLLCCDGLWNQLPEPFMNQEHWKVSAQQSHASCLTALAQAAVGAAAGKSDNVSAVWIHPHGSGIFAGNRNRTLITGLLGAAAILFLGGSLYAHHAVSTARAERQAQLQAAKEQAEREKQKALELAQAAAEAEKKHQEAVARAKAENEARAKAAEEARAKAEAEAQAKAKAEAEQERKAQEEREKQERELAEQQKAEKDQAIQELKKQKIEANQYGTHLCKAAREGKLELVRLLLKSGAEINSTDKQGRTPLYHASEKGHVDIVKWLISNTDVDVLKAAKNEKTPKSVAKTKEIKNMLHEREEQIKKNLNSL